MEVVRRSSACASPNMMRPPRRDTRGRVRYSPPGGRDADLAQGPGSYLFLLCQRVRLRSFLCFFLRIFLRRFFTTELNYHHLLARFAVPNLIHYTLYARDGRKVLLPA